MPVKSAIQKGIGFNYSRNQPISDLAIAQKQRSAASENISVKEKEKNAKEKKVLQLKEEHCCLKDNLYKQAFRTTFKKLTGLSRWNIEINTARAECW